MLKIAEWVASALMCLVFLILGMMLNSSIKESKYIYVTNEVQVYKVDRLTITSEYHSITNIINRVKTEEESEPEIGEYR